MVKIAKVRSLPNVWKQAEKSNDQISNYYKFSSEFRSYGEAKTHGTPHLDRSFSAKEPLIIGFRKRGL